MSGRQRRIKTFGSKINARMNRVVTVGRWAANRRAMSKWIMPEMVLKERDMDEVQRALGDFSGVLKLYMGAVNNATYLVLGNAMDAMKRHPVWAVKFHKAKGQYLRAIKEWKAYEYQLLHAKENRMFHLADYSEEIRKKYGDITDQEYYDYWCSIGAFAYDYSKNEMNSLKYKYRKVLESHGIEGAAELSEAMLCLSCLNMAVQMLEVHLERGVNFVGMKKMFLEFFFKDFSLKKVRDAWYNALVLTIPDFMEAELEEIEDRNVELGITQLAERWVDDGMLMHAVNDATEDYQEVFRTQGEWKKALREIRTCRMGLGK